MGVNVIEFCFVIVFGLNRVFFFLWFGYLKQGNLQNPNPVECKARKLLPDNMLYLLVMCPFMLPAGTGQIRFQDRFAKAIQFFKHNKGMEGRRLAKGYVPHQH